MEFTSEKIKADITREGQWHYDILNEQLYRNEAPPCTVSFDWPPHNEWGFSPADGDGQTHTIYLQKLIRYFRPFALSTDIAIDAAIAIEFERECRGILPPGNFYRRMSQWPLPPPHSTRILAEVGILIGPWYRLIFVGEPYLQFLRDNSITVSMEDLYKVHDIRKNASESLETAANAPLLLRWWIDCMEVFLTANSGARESLTRFTDVWKQVGKAQGALPWEK